MVFVTYQIVLFSSVGNFKSILFNEKKELIGHAFELRKE